MLRSQNSEAYGDIMERRQLQRSRYKDKHTRLAYMLTCLQCHVILCLSNGTSLLAVTCPCKNHAGWPFWCPYRNVAFPAYTVPLRYTLTAQTRFIRTYTYEYTHICVCLYAHTRMFIRTYAFVYTHIRAYLYAYTRIYAYTCESDMSLLFRMKTCLCVSLLWKRKSLTKRRTHKEKFTYCAKLMEIMLQPRTSHRFKYLLNDEKKQFIFIFCCWWIRTKRKMLLKLCIWMRESSGDILSEYSHNTIPAAKF